MLLFEAFLKYDEFKKLINNIINYVNKDIYIEDGILFVELPKTVNSHKVFEKIQKKLKDVVFDNVIKNNNSVDFVANYKGTEIKGTIKTIDIDF